MQYDKYAPFRDRGDGFCQLSVTKTNIDLKTAARKHERRLVLSAVIFSAAAASTLGVLSVKPCVERLSVAFRSDTPGIYAKYSREEDARWGLPLAPLFAVANIGKTNAVLSTTFTASDYTYTGSSLFIDDGDGHCRIKFTTSGTFTSAKTFVFDLFAVGGGAGGMSSSNYQGKGGGGGGRTLTQLSISLSAGTGYSFVVGSGGAAGAAGSSTTALGYTATGGSIPSTSTYGGAGGSGGGAAAGTNHASGLAGGSDGSNGLTNTWDNFPGGAGQGTTTREFGQVGATLYAGGGGGGAYDRSGNIGGAGGDGGGGAGGNRNQNGVAGTANTGGGGGGGGCYSPGGVGGSGIIVLRDHRE